MSTRHLAVGTVLVLMYVAEACIGVASAASPSLPAAARIGPALHPPRITVATAIARAQREGWRASWTRHGVWISYGSWRPKQADGKVGRLLDVWRLVSRNVTVTYRACPEAHRPGVVVRVSRCKKYHNIVALVSDTHRPGIAYYYF